MSKNFIPFWDGLFSSLEETKKFMSKHEMRNSKFIRSRIIEKQTEIMNRRIEKQKEFINKMRLKKLKNLVKKRRERLANIPENIIADLLNNAFVKTNKNMYGHFDFTRIIPNFNSLSMLEKANNIHIINFNRYFTDIIEHIRNEATAKNRIVDINVCSFGFVSKVVDDNHKSGWRVIDYAPEDCNNAMFLYHRGADDSVFIGANIAGLRPGKLYNNVHKFNPLYRRNIIESSNMVNIFDNLFESFKQISTQDAQYFNIMVDIEFIFIEAFIGDKIPENFIENLAKRLRVFSPVQDRQFHELTACSTTLNRMCIYETYYYLHVETENITKNYSNIKIAFDLETKEIINYVKKGELYEFIKHISKRDNKFYYVMFYKPIQEGVKNIYGFYFSNTEFIPIYDISILNDQKVFLSASEHVAPAYFNDLKNQKDYQILDCINYTVENNSNKSLFRLEPTKSSIKIISDIWAFDFETLNNTDISYTLPYCVCAKSKNGLSYSDYSENSELLVINFCKFIDSLATKYDVSKTKRSDKIENIIMYGFNNAKFDNLLFCTEFIKLYGSNVKCIYAGAAIKSINYFNISIHDLNLYYAGSLSATAKSFKLDEIKTFYPYKFAIPENLFYIGPVPDSKYWEIRDGKSDYDNFIMYDTMHNLNPKAKNWGSPNLSENMELPGLAFDMQKITLEYCNNDCELTLKIGIKHVEQCKLDINGIKNDVSMCKTAASIALKTFTNCFLKKTLYGSPKDIQKIEKMTFKGGRTGATKKYSNPGELILALDINSAHPASQHDYEMPTKFKRHYKFAEMQVKEANLIPHNIYRAKTENIAKIQILPNLNFKSTPEVQDIQFIQDAKPILRLQPENVGVFAQSYIPNLIYKGPKLAGSFINTPKSYHYGCELNESILNGETVFIDELLMYESDNIFAGYVKCIYDERVIAKRNKNAARSNFLKLLLNSLYGKFAQRQFEEIIITDNDFEINKIMKNKNFNITSWEKINNSIDDEFLKISYQNKDRENESVGELVRIASYITAQTRCKLSKMMRIIGHENVFYFDTDSIYTNNIKACHPDNEYINSSVLGAWKLENISVDCKFDGAKSYTKNELWNEEYFNNHAELLYSEKNKSFNDIIYMCKSKIDDNDNGHTENKNKGIPGRLLESKDYGLDSGVEIKMTMFKRFLSGVKIETCTRTKNNTANNSRKFNKNNRESVAYNDYEECLNARF